MRYINLHFTYLLTYIKNTFTPLGLHTNTDMRELISVQGWRTEREVVFTGCIDATETHNLAAECHDTRSAVHVTRYLCNTATRGHVSLRQWTCLTETIHVSLRQWTRLTETRGHVSVRHVDMSHWDNTRSVVHVTWYLCNTAHHVTTTATRGHVSLRQYTFMSHWDTWTCLTETIHVLLSTWLDISAIRHIKSPPPPNVDMSHWDTWTCLTQNATFISTSTYQVNLCQLLHPWFLPPLVMLKNFWT